MLIAKFKSVSTTGNKWSNYIIGKDDMIIQHSVGLVLNPTEDDEICFGLVKGIVRKGKVFNTPYLVVSKTNYMRLSTAKTTATIILQMLNKLKQ